MFSHDQTEVINFGENARDDEFSHYIISMG